MKKATATYECWFPDDTPDEVCREAILEVVSYQGTDPIIQIEYHARPSLSLD